MVAAFDAALSSSGLGRQVLADSITIESSILDPIKSDRDILNLMPEVYILECKDGRFYVGSANNLSIRLIDHNHGKCKFTKSRLPVRLVYKEKYSMLSLARKRERQIKNWKSRFMIEKLVKSYVKAPSSNGSGH